MQTQESNVDTGKALDADLVVTESSGTESEVQDESSRLGNDTNTDDVDIRPITTKSQWLRSKTIEQTTSLLANNADLKAQIHEKCVFNVNHDACIATFLKEMNSRATIESNKTRNSNKSIEQKSHTQKPVRWKPTGRIFNTIGLRWILTGKILASYTSKDDSKPTHGSNVDIPNTHECKQTLDLSIDLESLFDPLFDEYFNGENQVVSKSSAVTTTDAFDKHQQQPDSTSSTSTLATTVTADGNFDL
ncbi:hypothetical protein Tco_0377277 [Tanacetum coccineum]